MRRLKNKIKIEPLSEALFRELLQRVAVEKGVPCKREMEDFIVAECLRRSPDGLRACYPVDLMTIIAGMAKFEERAPILEKTELEQALKMYFVH